MSPTRRHIFVSRESLDVKCAYIQVRVFAKANNSHGNGDCVCVVEENTTKTQEERVALIHAIYRGREGGVKKQKARKVGPQSRSAKLLVLRARRCIFLWCIHHILRVCVCVCAARDFLDGAQSKTLLLRENGADWPFCRMWSHSRTGP